MAASPSSSVRSARSGGERQVVGDDTDRAPLVAQRGEQVEQLHPRAAVLAEGRLVEDEDRWRGGQRGRDRQASLLAAGERERVRLGQVGEVEPLEQLLRPLPRRGGVASPACSGPSASSSATDPARNWCSGSWNTVPMERTRRRAPPAPERLGPWPRRRAPRRRPRTRWSAGAGRRGAGPGSTCRSRSARRSPAPRRSALDVGRPAARAPAARKRERGPSARTSVGPRARCRAGGAGSGWSGTQIPAAASSSPWRAKTSAGGPSAITPPPASSTTHPVDQVDGLGDAMLDQEHRRPAAGDARRRMTSRTSAAPSGSRLAVGSSSSSRPGRSASDAGERQPLLLPAGEAHRSGDPGRTGSRPPRAPRRPAARSRPAGRSGSRGRRRRRRRRAP